MTKSPKWLGRQVIIYTTPLNLPPLPPSGEHRGLLVSWRHDAAGLELDW
jgi:hypothetical protein